MKNEFTGAAVSQLAMEQCEWRWLLHLESSAHLNPFASHRSSHCLTIRLELA